MGTGTVSLCAEHGHTCPFVWRASICCGGCCRTAEPHFAVCPAYEIDQLVVLRMNREFMKFGRQYYAHRLNEPFGKFGTVLTVESNVEMGAVDLDSDSHSD